MQKELKIRVLHGAPDVFEALKAGKRLYRTDLNEDTCFALFDGFICSIDAPTDIIEEIGVTLDLCNYEYYVLEQEK